MVSTKNPPTLREGLGGKFDALIDGLVPVLEVVSLRDLRFGLADLPDISWSDALDQRLTFEDRPVPSRREARLLREQLVHLDAVTRDPQLLTTELAELLARVPSMRAQWIEICVDLWGWDGTGRKTPGLVAWRHRVTRERVHQVSQIMQGRLARIGRPVYLPTAQAIAGIVTDLADSATRFHVSRLAMDRQLITDAKELDALEALEAAGLVPAGTWRWGALVESPVPRRRRRRSAHVESELAPFRELVSSLKTRNNVYLVTLEPGEKPETVRRRLLQAASETDVDVALRKHADGWVVGLMTADRQRGARAGSRQAD